MNDFTQYFGIPFEYGGRDRKALDCYGLVMLIYKDIHNIEIPDVISPTFLADIENLINAEKYKWESCDLEQGCVILFNVKGYGSHVGYYLGDDKMIHTWEGTGGPTIERLAYAWKNRIIGTYKWKNQNNS